MCPPCKVIIDGGTIGGGGRLLARKRPEVAAAAHYLADISEASVRAIMQGVRSGALTPEQIDEAHAWSELECHRAAVIRDSAVREFEAVRVDNKTIIVNEALLMQWAEETRIHTTALIGGEYHGSFEVDGITGIRKRD